MHCNQADNVIDAYMDGELVEELNDAFERHAATCADCRTRIDAERALRGALASLPLDSPPVGRDPLTRSGPTIESIFGADLGDPEFAIEVSYEGAYELDEDRLADGGSLDDDFGALGGWIAATLVQVGDVALAEH